MSAPTEPVSLVQHGRAGVDAIVLGEQRHRLETEILPAYVAARRWYRAKDFGRPAVELAETCAVEVEGGTALAAMLAVTPPGRAPDRYFLPLMLVDADAGVPEHAIVARVTVDGVAQALVDAAGSAAFARALVDLICAAPRQAGRLLARRTAALADVCGELARAPVALAGGEQSNTSLRLAGAMLKILRKLEPGINPELEVGRYLTEQRAFRNVPDLLGSIEWTTPAQPTGSLCVLQRAIPNLGDGWTFAMRRLADADRAAATADLLRLARLIGRRTAELHRALAADTGDPAFAPEPAAGAFVRDWLAAVTRQARAALERLDNARAGLDRAERELADALGRRAATIGAWLDALAPDRVGADRTRLHGDYHLGQLLVVDDDIFIIDFEGEPMRALSDRRAKHLPMKDVAGMLRSFAYLDAAAQGGGPRAADPADGGGLGGRMSSAFLAAYADSIRPCRSFPADAAAADRLLKLFVLEKAFYELHYELANRPAWVGIPLRGIARLLDGEDIAFPREEGR